MKILLLDGFNLAFRSYYALPELTRSDGFPTGAIHAWVKTLWKLEDLEKPDWMHVFFDSGGSTRHLELLPEYKANRSEMPEALSQQLDKLWEVAGYMGCPTLSKSGVEADDLIASAAQRYAEQGNEVVIVSADKDLGQCVNRRVSQLLPAPAANPRLGWRKLDAAGIENKFAITPEQIPDYLALVGDTSDNIPGLAGVGPKTAAKWLHAYHKLETILENAKSIVPKRFQAKVFYATADLRRNLKLVTLERHHNIEVQAVQAKPEKLIAFLEEMEMQKSIYQAKQRYSVEYMT